MAEAVPIILAPIRPKEIRMSTIAPTRSSAGLARWGALGGILYVVLFVIGAILLFDGTPDGDASPAKVIAYYSDWEP